MIKPTRVLRDNASGRTYYIDSQGNAYADPRFLKHVKCGLGHNMWSSGEFLICSKCQEKFNSPKVKCDVIPFEETKQETN